MMEYVTIPIRIKAYMHKGNGRPAYSMTVKKAYERQPGSNGNGELF